MREQYVRFLFGKTAPMDEVEKTLRLACLAAESLHGPQRVRLEAKYRIHRSKRTCSIDSSSEVGLTLALIFGGYARCEFGRRTVRMHSVLKSLSEQIGGAHE